MKTRNVVRGIVYDFFEGEPIFLLLHAPEKDYWGNPQGGIDGNEGELEALVREINEETDLEVDPSNIDQKSRYKTGYGVEREGEMIRTVLFAFAVKGDSEKELVLEVHDKYLWVGYEEAYQMMSKFPNQRDVFENVCGTAGLKSNYD